MNLAANESDAFGWLRRVLGGDGTGRQRDYLCRPSVARPELLIPLRPRRAAAASLQRFHDDRSVAGRLAVIASQGVAAVGLLERVPGDRVSVTPFALVEDLARRLGEPELIPAISLGPPRRNRKPVIQLLRPDGSTVGFAKIGWSEFTRELIGNEGRWLRAVDGRLPPSLAAPAVLVDDEVAGNHVVVSASLPTPVHAHRRHPFAPDVLRSLARVADPAREPIGQLRWWDEVSSPALAEAVDLDAIRDRDADHIIDTGMWHGDLTPWNTATVGGRTVVWDWEFAGGHRPVGFEALHIAFESVRRASVGNEAAAVESVLETGDATLAPYVQAESRRAVIDLYLVELLHRELRLAGQGWNPGHLGPLDQELLAALRADRRG